MLLLLSCIATFIILCSFTVRVNRQSENTVEMSISKNGEDFRVRYWERGGLLAPIIVERGWVREVNRGDGWQLLEEGKGKCPYAGDGTGESWTH